LTEEKVDFARKLLVGGNLVLFAWIILAFLSVFFYNQIAGWIYLLLLSFLFYAVLRRLSCNNCYQCKTCTSGFGRISGIFFGKGFVKKASVGNRLIFVIILYGLLFPVPLILLSLSFLEIFSILKVAVLIFLLCITFFSIFSWLSNSSTKPIKV
jgi:hypothetical protein